MTRVAAVALLILAAAAFAIFALGAGDDDGGDYKVRAIFDNAGFVIPGEDVKVAGVKVGSIDSIDVTDDFKAAVVLDITDPGYQDFRQDAGCIVRPQSLIGERFVECELTEVAVAGRGGAAAARADRGGRRRGPVPAAGRAQRQGGRPRPDQQHHARAGARAPVDHPLGPRHRRRRPRPRPVGGHPPRRPGAEGDRRGAEDPRRAERRARRPRARLRHGAGAAGARAPPRQRRDRERGRGRGRDGRAARRPRGRPRAPSRVPAGAQADDGPARRAQRRDDAGADRPRRGGARHQPDDPRARPVLARRDPGLRVARRGGRSRHAGGRSPRGP